MRLEDSGDCELWCSFVLIPTMSYGYMQRQRSLAALRWSWAAPAFLEARPLKLPQPLKTGDIIWYARAVHHTQNWL